MSASQQDAAGRRGDIADFILLLLKYRRFLFLNTLTVTLVVLGISFLLPVRYRATATMLPPQESGEGLLGLSSLIQKFDDARQMLTGASSSSQIYLAILKSRTVADRMISEFDLVNRYDVANGERARNVLRRRASFKLNPAGIIEVSVEDRDRETAAKMANALLAHLDELNRSLRMSEGKRARIFIAERLAATRERLAAAEDSLRVFQEANPGTVMPPDVAAAAAAAGEIMARRIAAGVELEILSASLLPGAAPLVRQQTEIAAMDRQLENLPALNLELGRRFRDFTVQEKVFAFLNAQYEDALIRENRDVTTVDVLDEAVPPVRKSYPRRGVLTALACVISLAGGLCLIMLREGLGRRRLDEDPRFDSIVPPGGWLDRIFFGRSRARTP